MDINLQKLLMLVFFSFFVCIISAGVCVVAVITIDDNGGADFLSDHATIDNTGTMDVIQIAAETYCEDVLVIDSVTVKFESHSSKSVGTFSTLSLIIFDNIIKI